MATIGEASVRIVADARGFARDAEREINRELSRINPDQGVGGFTRRVNQKVEADTSRGFLLAARNAVTQFGIVMQGGISVQAAASFGIAVIAVLIPVVIAAGTLLAGALVGAFGAGIVGLAIALQAQSPAVEEAFSDLRRRVGDALEVISEPFEDVLVEIANIANDVAAAFILPLAFAFEALAPVVEQFARDLGDAFVLLAPTIGPITEAFTAILEDLGPALVEEIFPGLTQAIINVADAIAENSEVFVTLLTFLFDMIEGLINFSAELVRLADWFAEHPEAIIAALGAVAVALIVLSGGFLAFVGAAIAVAAAIAIAWDDIKAASQALQRFVFEVVFAIEGFFESLGRTAGEVFDSIVANIGSAVADIGRFARNIGDSFARLGRFARDLWSDIREAFGNIVSGAQGLPGAIGRAVSGVASALWSPFRDGLNRIIRGWNSLSFSLPSVDLGPLGSFGGFTIGTPNIPLLQQGGIIQRAGGVIVGDAGPEFLTLPAGAQVTPLPSGGDGAMELTGDLFLDSGEFLGVVRGQVSTMFGEVASDARAGIARG